MANRSSNRLLFLPPELRLEVFKIIINDIHSGKAQLLDILGLLCANRALKCEFEDEYVKRTAAILNNIQAAWSTENVPFTISKVNTFQEVVNLSLEYDDPGEEIRTIHERPWIPGFKAITSIPAHSLRLRLVHNEAVRDLISANRRLKDLLWHLNRGRAGFPRIRRLILDLGDLQRPKFLWHMAWPSLECMKELLSLDFDRQDRFWIREGSTFEMGLDVVKLNEPAHCVAKYNFRAYEDWEKIAYRSSTEI